MAGNNPVGLLGPVAPSWGGIFAALKDAGSYLGGSGSTDNFSNFQSQNQNRQAVQGLLSGLTSDDPVQRQQAYAIAPLYGVDPKGFQQARASQALPQLLTAMQPQQVQSPAAQADAGQFGQINVPATNIGTAPGMSFQDALMQAPPEAQAQYLPQLLEKQLAGPVKVGKDDRLFSPNDFSKPIVDVAPEPIDYNKAFFPDGKPNTAFQSFALSERQAGRPQTNVNVSADKSFGTTLGGNVANVLDASAGSAKGALQTIDAANQVRAALDAPGGISAGPGANVGQFLNQAFNGDPAKVANTRNAIQGLARLTMGARSALKGQGQISDYEGKLLQRAASGEINDMTPGEIRIVANTADKLSRIQIQQNRENVTKARKVAGNAQGMVDFYDVPEPPTYKGPQAAVAAPAGIDPKIWSHMTPQEQALWQK